MTAPARAGILYVVATPIGNLADASPRSIEVLRGAAVVACEDTRTSRTLLAHHGIAARTVALHEHNEREAAAKLLGVLRDGGDVALVSDAGTPAVSDPGARLVEAAHAAGIRVVPVPGPNAAVAAFCASGFASPAFQFAGFLPAKGKGPALEGLDAARPVILYEAPHRVRATVRALLERFGGEREIVVARELTKKFEEVARMRLADAPAWFEAAPHREQGEFVLVLGPGEAQAADAAEGERVLRLLMEKLPAGDAARLASRITGVPRNVLYRIALENSK